MWRISDKWRILDFLLYIVRGEKSTYSWHCAEDLSSAARVTNTFTKDAKFPVLQLLMAKFFKIGAVDSSNNL